MSEDNTPQISGPRSFAQHYVIAGSNYSEVKAEESLLHTLRGPGRILYTVFTTALGDSPLHIHKMPGLLTVGNSHRLHIYGDNIDMMNGAVAGLHDTLLRERLSRGLAASSLGAIDQARYSLPPTSPEGQLLNFLEELRQTRTVREMTNDLRNLIEGPRKEERKIVF